MIDAVVWRLRIVKIVVDFWTRYNALLYIYRLRGIGLLEARPTNKKKMLAKN